MKLRALDIQRLPGINEPYAIETFSPGVNVVFGPNASGKSSLCRAFRALLYEQERVQGPLQLTARLELGSGEASAVAGIVEVERVGPLSRWTGRDGEIERPALPDYRHVGCYTIALDDLLAPGLNEEQLAARVARELSGGFDLRAVSGAPPFRLKANHARPAADQVGAAGSRLAEVRKAHAALREQVDTLEDLEREKADSDRAALEAQQYQAALGALAESRARRACERALAVYPSDMTRLHGDELERLQELRERVDALKPELRKAQARLATVYAEQADAGRHGIPSREELEQAAGQLRAVQEADRDIAQLERRRREALRRTERAASELGGAGVDDAVASISTIPIGSQRGPRLEPRQIARVEDRLDKKRILVAKLTEMDAASERSSAPAFAGRPEDLETARDALLAWLAAASPGTGTGTGTGTGAASEVSGGAPWRGLIPELLVGLGVGLGASWLAVSVPLTNWWLLLPALPIVLGLGWRTRWVLRAAAVRGAAEARYALTGISPPQAWSALAVRQQLGQVEQWVLDSRAALAEAAEKARLEPARERLALELSTLTARLESIAREVGFSPQHLDASFERWLRLTHALDDARRELDAVDAELHGVTERRARIAAALGSMLAGFEDGENRGRNARTRHGSDPDGILEDELGRRLRRLESRVRTWEGTSAARQVAEADVQHAQESLAECEDQRARLLADSGARAAVGDRPAGGAAQGRADRPADEHTDEHTGGHPEQVAAEHELRQRLVRLDDWRQEVQALNRARATEQRAFESIAAAPELRQLVADDAEEALRQQLQAAELRAARRDELATEITEIRARLRQAREGHDLERAGAEHAEALDMLGDELSEALFAHTGRFLLDEVEREHVRSSRPRVLDGAQKLFGRFTNHRFGLEFEDGDPPRFSAHDTATGATLTLGQLSLGTRMQLLLALRLAYAEELEQGATTMPVFVDEALATADPDRFRAIAHCLAEIALAQDRQVIYLTAQPHEAVQWEDAGVDVNIIDLKAVRAQGTSVPDWHSVLHETPDPIPGAAGKSPAEFARAVGVTPVLPWSAATQTHLFHLLRDHLEGLAELLRLRVENAGQLASLLDSAAMDWLAGICDGPWGPSVEATQRELRLRLEVLEAFFAVWRVGRGRPLASVVLQSAPLTPRFLPEVARVADACGGNAAAVLERLEAGAVHRFGSQARAKLARWLAEEGYLDERPKFAASQRLVQVLAKVRAWHPEISADQRSAESVRAVVGWLENGLEPAQVDAPESAPDVFCAGAESAPVMGSAIQPSIVPPSQPFEESAQAGTAAPAGSGNRE